MTNSQKKDGEKSLRLSRANWLAAARDALIDEGKDGVKVRHLAKRLNVTRGGFYWHFKDRDDLLDSVLNSWERETNTLFEQALQGDHIDSLRKFCALVRIWINEDVFNPAYDSAGRDWHAYQKVQKEPLNVSIASGSKLSGACSAAWDIPTTRRISEPVLLTTTKLGTTRWESMKPGQNVVCEHRCTSKRSRALRLAAATFFRTRRRYKRDPVSRCSKSNARVSENIRLTVRITSTHASG